MKTVTKIKIISTAFLLFLLLSYIIDWNEGFSKHEKYFEFYILPILTMLIISAISFFLNDKIARIFIASLYLTAGIITTAISDSGNTTGIIFLITAFVIHKEYKEIAFYIVASLTTISMLIKALIWELNVMQMSRCFALYVAIFLVWYFILQEIKSGKGSCKKKQN